MQERDQAPLTVAHPLIALCLAFTLLVALHTAATPIFEAPDEVWHYAYVRWIAEGHGLPPLDEDLSGAYQEAAQPPLYYLVAALISMPFDDQDLQDLMWSNPGFGYQSPGNMPDNKNMLIHTRDEALPWRGAALTLHATRLTSWVFGLLTVIAAWGFGYEAFRSRQLALVTAALVAFQPQFVFLASVVSNDSAAAAVATTALWLGARIVNRGSTPRRTLYAGFIGGLAMLTKTSTLLVAPMLAVCLLAGTLWHRKGRVSRASWPRALARLAAQLGITAAIGGWWYLRNATLYGTLLGLVSHTETLWARAEPATLVELIPETPLVLRSFWAAYGWGHVTWPNWVYVALWTITLPLLAVGVSATLHAWLRALKHAGGLRELLTAGPGGDTWTIPAAMATCWFTGIALALLRWMQQVEAPHGRLLFPAIGAWALLLALGVRQIGLWRPRIGRRYQTGLITAGVVLTTLAPGGRILATFMPPRLQAPNTILDTCTNPVDLRYANWARLLCAEAAPVRVAPGDEVTVTACWESLAPTAQDLTVFAHLIGPEAARPAERHTYPGLGRYPTSLWAPGTAFCDTFTMAVAEWAETPVRYELEVGLFDADSGTRLTAQAPNGRPVEPPLVGSVDVAPLTVPPEMTSKDFVPSDALALFGEGPILAHLLFADAPAEANAGSDITITLHWRAMATADVDYIAFIHIWTPGADAPLAQDDSQPRNGWFPTTAWADGDYIPDQHTLHLPEDLAPGTYPLWAGLYNPADGSRVPATGAPGRFDHDMVPLGEIEIHSLALSAVVE
ncbi:MAG: glycosyltransferase family 39 protein [Anaerolineae bacterium]|nr:glycosyltransferase family 39 protein [Anaerolineae bacterium]